MTNPVLSQPVMIVLIIVAGLVICLALWVGSGLVLRKNTKGLFFAVKEKRKEQQPKGEDIKVAEELQLTDVIGRDIAGKIVEGGDAEETKTNSIEVAKKSTIKKSKIRDIVGLKQVGSESKDKS